MRCTAIRHLTRTLPISSQCALDRVDLLADLERVAEAEAAARMDETKRLAAEYEAMGGVNLTKASAEATSSGDPLRERWYGHFFAA